MWMRQFEVFVLDRFHPNTIARFSSIPNTPDIRLAQQQIDGIYRMIINEALKLQGHAESDAWARTNGQATDFILL